jgi:large subunit ribosomal protein L22
VANVQKDNVIEVRAQAKYVRCSTRKARVVLDTIRGRSVPEARTVLTFSTRAVARDIYKVLHSAASNAEVNHGLVADSMVISACYADNGPTMKRFRPRARGRSAPILKRSCHITIRLKPQEQPAADRHSAAKSKRAESAKPDAKAGSPATPVAKSKAAPDEGTEKPRKATTRRAESEPQTEKAAATKAKPAPARKRKTAGDKAKEESS